MRPITDVREISSIGYGFMASKALFTALDLDIFTRLSGLPQNLDCLAREAGVRPSMGHVGDAYDNALCESFFATLECELLDRRRFPTQAEARMAVFDFIEGWYNPHRRHSGLDYESPISYEQRHPVVA